MADSSSSLPDYTSRTRSSSPLSRTRSGSSPTRSVGAKSVFVATAVVMFAMGFVFDKLFTNPVKPMAQSKIMKQTIAEDPDESASFLDEMELLKMADSQLAWKSDGSNSTLLKQTPVMNYMHHPQEMVAAFKECEKDPKCHIMFHHAYKTGGTTIEYCMRKIFNESKILSCCEETMMHKFYLHPRAHCQRKFSGYQVGHEEFLEIVHWCKKFQPKVLILTSFRDPVGLMVSWIHQMCNKLAHKRSPEVLKACKTCDYNKHTNVWLGFANETIRQLDNVYRVAHYHPRYQTELKGRKFRVFTLELPDITDFFTAWKPKKKFPLSRNGEELSTCNFYTPSELIKYLRPANEHYRKLVAGY